MCRAAWLLIRDAELLQHGTHIEVLPLGLCFFFVGVDLNHVT
jgi:hypothetical protein